MPHPHTDHYPLDIFGLGPDITRKILFILLVASSSKHAHWYYSFANVSNRTQATIDSLLQEPGVLEHLTFWDKAVSQKECEMLDRITERGLKNVRTIKIVATDSCDLHGHKPILLWRLRSLQHLDIRGTSSYGLPGYLRYFQRPEQQLTHLTTDCWFLLSFVFTFLWPRKVTIVHVPSVHDVVVAAAAGYIRGMDELEIASVQLFEAVQAFDPRTTDSLSLDVNYTMAMVWHRRYEADETHRAAALQESWAAGKFPFKLRTTAAACQQQPAGPTPVGDGPLWLAPF